MQQFTQLLSSNVSSCEQDLFAPNEDLQMFSKIRKKNFEYFFAELFFWAGAKIRVGRPPPPPPPMPTPTLVREKAVQGCARMFQHFNELKAAEG